MKTILLPTDFSDRARNAIRYALRFFGNEKVKFVLLSAYDLPSRSTEIIVYAMRGRIGAEAERALRAELDTILKGSGLPRRNIERVSQVGDLASAIVHYTQKHSVDFIVMGTPANTGSAEFLGGNRMKDLLRRVNCPIITIPDRYRFKAPQLIALVVDVKSVIRPEDILPVRSLAERYGSSIIALKVINKSAHGLETDQIEKLRLLLGKTLSLSSFFVEERAVEDIGRCLAYHRPDLLITIPGRFTLVERWLQKSITSRLERRTGMPVLALRS